jgi:hypothetical protein
MDEYLTIPEVAARLKLSAKSVRNKMAGGVFRKGVHFFRRPGVGPRFKWSAVVAWLEGSQQAPAATQLDEGIPMARGYVLRTGVDIAKKRDYTQRISYDRQPAKKDSRSTRVDTSRNGRTSRGRTEHGRTLGTRRSRNSRADSPADSEHLATKA